MQKTTNFNLNQWEPHDEIKREDFNADNAAVDAALAELTAAMPKIVCGTYTGDGAASQTIELGFTPKVILVCDRAGHFAHDINCLTTKFFYGALAMEGNPAIINNTALLTIVDGGFSVIYKIEGNNNYVTNKNGTIYYYVAVG